MTMRTLQQAGCILHCPETASQQPSLTQKVNEKVIANLCSSFRKCSIYPLDPQQVISRLQVDDQNSSQHSRVTEAGTTHAVDNNKQAL